jgi:RNA polymerase sigma-70 factor (ECF subfamily)
MEKQSIYHYGKSQLAEEQDHILAAKKDPAAFAPLYRAYHERIFLFVLKRVESEELASDITSQVFLKALNKIGKYENRGLPFGSWLFRIARNEIYDQYAASKIELVLSVETSGLKNMISEFGEDEKLDTGPLYNALSGLNTEETELIELRFFEERPFKEIAEILDITENNAKVKTYRLLEKLKKILQNER